MAGYNYRRGMSRNAVDAYRRNLKPISRFTAQDLRDANIEISLASPSGWPRRNIGRPVAWHHSSEFYDQPYEDRVRTIAPAHPCC